MEPIISQAGEEEVADRIPVKRDLLVRMDTPLEPLFHLPQNEHNRLNA